MEMDLRTFHDFDIEIIQIDEGYASAPSDDAVSEENQADEPLRLHRYLATIKSPDGRRAQCSFTFPFTEYQLKYYISEVTRGPQPVKRGVESGPVAAAKEMGTQMFDALFVDDARRRLDAALDGLDAQSGLRIRLDLHGAPELAALPWEYLFHPERHVFLALSPDTAFVRYVETPERVRPLEVKPPLRVLAMACSPQDLPPLNLALERQQLEQSLSKLTKAGLVQIDWLEENSLAAINDALERKDYHVFHFMGHGAFEEGETGTNGVLLLEDEDGYALAVTGESLGWILRRSVKLAVLNACEGARDTPGDLSTGVASSLLLQGVPAVVGMQFDISDAVAVHFAHDFYSAIAIGLPVDAAATRARRNVMARFNTSAEWATPILFMRSPNGRIFDLDVSEQSADVAEVRAQLSDWDSITALSSSLVEKARALDVVDRLKHWWSAATLPAAPGDQPESLEEMYEHALACMEAERWDDANRLFKRINQINPGYRDIALRWHDSERQAQLAKIYQRLVSHYARQDWSKVIRECEEILHIVPSYRDTGEYYAQAQAALGLAQPDFPPPPPDLPPPGPSSEEGPSSLPDKRGSKPDKPPDLPD